MTVFRVILAIVIFSISCYLVYDLIANGFDWVVLIVCILGFLSVHYIWPKKVTDDSAWFDLLEHIVDLPYRAIALLLRTTGRLIRKGDGDFDIDL